ncbi:MAG: PAS domain S-box protein [Rhodospirillales bacterium]|nr:PAS domain S-box protein [Rhodospirillales bacterium]
MKVSPETKRLVLLVGILLSVATVVAASAIYIIYRGGVDRERSRLEGVVQVHARLLDSMTSFDRTYSNYPEGPEAAALRQFIDSQRVEARRDMGASGEFTIARRDGDAIVYLWRQREVEAPPTMSFNSMIDAPMRAALEGRSGTMIGRDYAGTLVLAAYEPVPSLNLGLVAKVDLAEVRARFSRAAAPLLAIGLITVLIATALFYRISEPLREQRRNAEARLRGLFEHMKSGAAVFEALADGSDFVFTDLNRRGEELGKIDRDQVVGKRLTETFPGVAEFGLLDALREVMRTGATKDLPPRVYRDERMQGWRDTHVYKLPTGELVTLFDDISAEIRAQRALRESEARFRGTFENAAVGIAHVGFDGAWLRVNERLCDIVGYGRDELLAKTFQEITHPDDLEADLSQLECMTRGEINSYSIEKRYIRKDGNAVWVNLTTALQRDEAGQPLYCISVVRDIGKRLLAEQTLRENETRMRALLDASADEILLSSTDGRVVAINKAAELRLAKRLGGASPLGGDLARLLPADLAETRLAIIREVAASGEPRHMDVPIRGRWFEFWFYPVRHSGQPIAEVAVHARDITDRKRAEADLRRLYQAIQQSPSSVVVTDRDANIVYVNPKFCDVTGYSREEVIGKNPRILKSGLTDPAEYRDLWQTISRGQVWRGEFHNKKKNGERLREIASVAPVKGEDGRIINFVAVKEDVTEWRAVEDQLRQSQKMQAIGQLTGGIAHDFNNLLTIIVGNLQLLELDLGGGGGHATLISDALWAATRGGELTHRLLAFARMQPLRPTVLNLNDVVGGLTELLRRTLGANIDIVEELDPDVANVVADAGELERALVNLTINARDAMPDGGTLTMQTRKAVLDADYVELNPDVAAGDYVMLSVSDTGTGMPKDMLTRIFEPFFTTKGVGHGSGLGLSMVYGFLKQSGGHISVYSELGGGTTFKLFFPQASTADTGTVDVASVDGGEFSGAGKIALVVEDEERLRRLATRLLIDAGFLVLEAGDGDEAMRLAQAAARIDLLFTDMELPGGMNGMAVAQGVLLRHPQVKVLFTTGYSAGLGARNGPLPPDATLIPKPYARQELARQLRAMFAEKAAEPDA